MKDNQTNSYNNLEEDSIDFIPLIKKVWFRRKFIIKVTLSFFIIGIIIALLSPEVYTSQTIFVPQVSSNEDMTSSKSGLGSIASLAGLNINSTNLGGDSYISPLLYTKISKSEEFALKVGEEQLINLNGEKYTIREYMSLPNGSLFNFNPIGLIKKYTIGLFTSKNKEVKSSEIDTTYNFINGNDFNYIQSFRKKFEIELNQMDGYITVKASDKDAFISTQLVKHITKNLQLKIIKLRTDKIKERLEYSKEQYEVKQNEFDLLQKQLAEFKDSNKNISTASFMSELQKLESEFRLQQSILFNLANVYNNNKIKLNRDTPIFSVIDEVSVPYERAKPKRASMVLQIMIIGVLLSIVFILGKDPLNKIILKLKD
jgi:uncharacterized protein involved in exopolysaccharide biosynthesis